MPGPKYKALLFDLYTALLNSWKLWNNVAGSEKTGLNWRQKYLELTYKASKYVPYGSIIEKSAQQVGLSSTHSDQLIDRWRYLEPWPETHSVLNKLNRKVPIAVVTNSSIELARIAVPCTGVSIPIVVTAEEAGYYKPNPKPYLLALARLGFPAAKVLFVAGSAADVAGSMGVGMPVYWHNRIGLSALNDKIKPLYISISLDRLLELFHIP